MRRALLALVLSLAVVLLDVAPATASPSNPAADESAFVGRINQLRASKGLGALRVDGELTAIGRRWAAKMRDAGRISHNKNFPNEVSSDWQKLGENVGVGSDVDELFQAFVDSPSHYANLVDRSFTHVGVGVVYARDGSLYTSHQFMQLRGSTQAAAPKPAAAPRPVAPPASRSASAAPAPAPPVTRPAATAAPIAQPAPAQITPPARLVLVLEELRRIGAYKTGV